MSPLQNLQRKTRHSARIQIRRQDRQSSQVWASSILRSSLTDFSVNSRLRPTSVAPQVAYKETITKPVDVDSKYAKQSGGRGQYGHCKVKFEPMDANGEETYKFESTVVGGAIPKEYIPAVGEGIEDAYEVRYSGRIPGSWYLCKRV